MIYNKTLSIYPTSYLIPIVILLFICFLLTLLDPQLVGVNSIVPAAHLTEIKNNVNSENDTKELQEIKVRKHTKNPLAISVNPQRIGIKGREMALVWHEKASRTALQTSSVLHTHTLLVQTHKHDVSAPWYKFI